MKFLDEIVLFIGMILSIMIGIGILNYVINFIVKAATQ